MTPPPFGCVTKKGYKKVTKNYYKRLQKTVAENGYGINATFFRVRNKNGYNEVTKKTKWLLIKSGYKSRYSQTVTDKSNPTFFQLRSNKRFHKVKKKKVTKNGYKDGCIHDSNPTFIRLASKFSSPVYPTKSLTSMKLFTLPSMSATVGWSGANRHSSSTMNLNACFPFCLPPRQVKKT